MTKSVAITMGDPLGIGPEIIVKSLQRLPVQADTEFVVLGAYRFFAKLPQVARVLKKNNIEFIDVSSPMKAPSRKQAGLLAMNALTAAVSLLKSAKVQALVTAPICKEHMALAGFQFPGHTEYLCHEFAVKKFAMMLFHERLKVVLTTIHLPLKNIFTKITAKNITEKLELTTAALNGYFKIAAPKIAVCGLNPHAGENGILGDEEKRIIAPAIAAFLKKNRQSRVAVIGPLSADSVFVDALQGRFDAVLCHYHDQALIPIKTTGFGEGVNLTLGLPFPRTSPDHGTAFDIAGQGMANSQSMIAAITAARKML